MSAVPTRKDEAYRYSDIAAVERHWPVAVETVTVAAGTTHADVIIADADAPAIRHLAIHVGERAAATLTILNAGRGYGRIALDVTLAAEARFDLGGVIIAHGSEVLEIVTTVCHAGPGAASRQTIRAVAGGQAVATYLGKVAVAREGQKTDAAQSFKALLLNRGATANAKPELEIFADDVKCAHGATVGELDKAALFYMASRGVPKPQAQALLTRAFLSDALAGLDEATAERLEARIDAAMKA